MTEDGGLLTPTELIELLMKCRLEILSREFYPEEERTGKNPYDIIRCFVFRFTYLNAIIHMHLGAIVFEKYKNHKLLQGLGSLFFFFLLSLFSF